MYKFIYEYDFWHGAVRAWQPDRSETHGQILDIHVFDIFDGIALFGTYLSATTNITFITCHNGAYL